MQRLSRIVLAVMCSSVGLHAQEAVAPPVVADSVPQQETPLPSSHRYFQVPIFGHLGSDVTPEAIEQVYREARQAGATHLVLLFNSNGGNPGAAAAIIRTITSNGDLRTVAFVREATGSAALVVATCQHVYVYPTGTWGARGEADQLEVQACRPDLDRLIGTGGRNPEVLAALANWESELHAIEDSGRLQIRARGENTRQLKLARAGFVLDAPTLVQLGVADAVAGNMGDLRRELGLNTWASCGDRGTEIVASLRREKQVNRVVFQPGENEGIPQMMETPGQYVYPTVYPGQVSREEFDRLRRQDDERLYQQRLREERERREADRRRELYYENLREQDRKRSEMNRVGSGRHPWR